MFPSKDTLKWMAGAYVTAESIEYLSSNEAAKQLPNNVLEAANTFLKDFKTVNVSEEIKTVTEEVKKETAVLKNELFDEVKALTKEQKQELIKQLND